MTAKPASTGRSDAQRVERTRKSVVASNATWPVASTARSVRHGGCDERALTDIEESTARPQAREMAHFSTINDSKRRQRRLVCTARTAAGR